MAHTSTCKERENFYRNSTLIVDHSNEAFRGLLHYDLTKQGHTLLQLIQAKQHEIYHLCYNNKPCCRCPPGSRVPVFGHNYRILNSAQLDILLDTSAKLPGHNQNSQTKHCCCPANPNINLEQLDLTLIRCLLLNFTTIIPVGSPERQAVDELIKFRNESYGHATKGMISDHDYQIIKAQIEKSIMVLAKAQGRESEFNQKLIDAAARTIDETILRQYQITLMANVEMIQTLIESAVGVKILPEYLTKDLEDIKVVEGCDARLELWTKDSDVNVEWFKGNNRIEIRDKYVVETSCHMHRLVVTNADLTDRGIYTAKFLGYEKSARLDIEEYFTKNLHCVECIEGETAEFTCEVIEYSLPACWSKNGVHLENDGKYEILQAGKIHRLSIKNCDLHDTSKYTVSINNRIRETSLLVIEYFTKPLGTMKCTEGETVQFECEVLDDIQSALWFKDGTEVNTSDRYKAERHGRLHRLVINTRLDDKGEYSVKIKNCVRHSQLFVEEMPTAIRNLSEEDKALYIDIIKSGTEVRYYLRIVLIGENGVDKTCLLRRLLKQSTSGVQSTDDIDIHRCRIRLRDGKWIFDEVSDKRKALLTRIKMASHSSTLKHETSEEKAYSSTASLLQDDGSENSNRESPHTSRNLSARKRKTSHALGKADSLTRKVKRRKRKGQSITTFPNSSENVEVEMETNYQPITKLLTEKVLQGLDDLLNGIEKVDVPADQFVECGILDIAGEKDYYPTDPIFLNPNALHILVANIMKDVKPITAEDGFDKIGEYIDFWLDIIHSFGVKEESKEDTKTEFLYPPAIIVCSRIDECRNQLQERKEIFRKQLLSLLRNETKKKHIREICFVSNTESDEENFNVLRDTIFKYGKQVKTFAERLPLRWIRLEQSIDVLREAKLNILSWADIVELSLKCSIDSENEINLFLKYQHKFGNVIYFESLKEYIILNQKWLANAFRCLVTDIFDSNRKLTDEWKTLEDTGKLEHSLIVKLFNKEPGLDFSNHRGHLLNVMEIFGIIVKLSTLMENGQRETLPTYYMPCMISKKTSFTDIVDMFNAKKDNCKRTPWLCIEFDFMPFDFFYNILCYYINQYSVCTEPQTGRMAIYHGMGVFFLDSTKFRKFVFCFCKNTIALQIWHWKDMTKGTCKSMLEELEVTIKRVKESFETRSVSYTVKSKCTDGNIHIFFDRHSYRELVDLGDKYFCVEHCDSHNTKDFIQTWFEDYTEDGNLINNKDDVQEQLKLKGQEGIQNARFKQKCHVCDKEPSVYWCRGCQRSMCQDCNNQHRESTATEYHIVQHVQDMYSLDYKFKVNVGRISDIKVLHYGVLVIADVSGKRLVTCDITGQQQHTIPLPGKPRRIAVVDNNTIAVSLLYTTTVVIVGVRQRQVIQCTDVKVVCYGILYRDNQLFVCCDDRTIKVMNMSGEVTRTIPMDVIPYYICGGEAGRIYYTDWVKLYCIDTVGNTLFTFLVPNMSRPWGIITDDEGHVHVICYESNNVLRISPNGKQTVIITQMPSSDWSSYICYNSLSKSVVIGCGDNVYVYKKV